MTTTDHPRTLYIVVCAAGVATYVGKLVALAQNRNWNVQLIATPAALDLIDVPALEVQTGHPIRTHYRKPSEPRTPRADAIIVAPATYNTINKWAAGISDTYALGILAEAPNLNIPVAVLPFVNTAMYARTPFQRSVEALTKEGVHILIGEDAFQPHPPGTGSSRFDTYPWQRPLEEIESTSEAN
ncbi:flavoprotein [Actinomadura rubteroloni]|uniref:flavoprotein n=1 Tax=Actinomadura rubteroloni TaxID=1926885 RepID=UPI000CD81ED2|nr:flavoprotein [Actinomadura rubteroloni]